MLAAWWWLHHLMERLRWSAVCLCIGGIRTELRSVDRSFRGILIGSLSLCRVPFADRWSKLIPFMTTVRILQHLSVSWQLISQLRRWKWFNQILWHFYVRFFVNISFLLQPPNTTFAERGRKIYEKSQTFFFQHISGQEMCVSTAFVIFFVLRSKWRSYPKICLVCCKAFHHITNRFLHLSAFCRFLATPLNLGKDICFGFENVENEPKFETNIEKLVEK